MSARIAEHVRSNVVAYLVLFLAITVVPVYAAGLKANSVKSRQIKNGQVKGVDVDPTQVQLRVGGSCQAGEAIRTINQDGTVACETDDQGGAPSGPAGGDLAGTYPNPTVGSDAVALGADTTGNYVASVQSGDGLTNISGAGEGATLNLGFEFSASAAGSPGMPADHAQFGPSRLVFEGASADGKELEVTVPDPSTDRTIALPDASGTVALQAGAGSFSPLTIGSGGTPITRHLSATGSLNFGTIAGNSCVDLTLTATGAAVGDTVALGVPAAAASPNIVYSAWVGTANSITVRGCNVGAASQAPTTSTFRADVWQH